MLLYDSLSASALSGNKQLAVLIDPDKINDADLKKLVELSVRAGVDYFFVGGSLLTEGSIGSVIDQLKTMSKTPVIIFPGNASQIYAGADAILLLSLISGRNADLLIGQHVAAAPFLKKSNLEILPTGYILIESGNLTTVQYITNTSPVPSDKPEIAASTALAGEQLGLKIIFAEAGSGAQFPVSAQVIQAIRKAVSIPLIVGGGIRTAQQALTAYHAGADLIVIGNMLEKDPEVILEIGKAAGKK